ncbi:sensor histidine kinase [Herbaspirillum sp. WKF16]|jgi:signal transduction histidine kinase|uniref:sensor histidine kinase n=1 Tax=Herbaspirillum sp. WKF16 TaxID=3028312 RepID=UPI0023A9B241|nr:sensor histidine kinase [Herbaspirillum sp. WKF16]WDZ94458.1 sensor histidine kinase [Herbaspirillum sp. WKF16]
MQHDTISGDRPQEALSLAEKIREQERARIARDLHDELGAHLTGIKMALAQLRTGLERSAGMEQPREQARYAEQLIDEAGDAMHGIIDDLCPPIVEFGLAEALEWQSRMFTRQTGIVCRQRCADGLDGLGEFEVITLFRIVREALSNVAKYAQADNASITVERAGSTLTLRIEDDGRGFDLAGAAREGSGLSNMRRRAQALDGTLHLNTMPGKGTAIKVDVPVAH